MVKIIECPRDAMQGIKEQIPTAVKAEYINQLMKVGFDTIDFGSFVSPKAIPQLADTAEVLQLIDRNISNTKLLAIIANVRGAEDACKHDAINYLGFPFSISETFQKRNTNSGIAESLDRVKRIQDLCIKHNKRLLIYISMAFGNPYGDKYHPDIAAEWSNKLANEVGVGIIALSDTIGTSNPQNISQLFSTLIPALPKVEFGAHLHTSPSNWEEKVEAAFNSGCRRFDGAIKGFGGCPMAEDELVGNMPTENMLAYFRSIKEETGIDREEMSRALLMAGEVFPN